MINRATLRINFFSLSSCFFRDLCEFAREEFFPLAFLCQVLYFCWYPHFQILFLFCNRLEQKWWNKLRSQLSASFYFSTQFSSFKNIIHLMLTHADNFIVLYLSTSGNSTPKYPRPTWILNITKSKCFSCSCKSFSYVSSDIIS